MRQWPPWVEKSWRACRCCYRRCWRASARAWTAPTPQSGETTLLTMLRLNNAHECYGVRKFAYGSSLAAAAGARCWRASARTWTAPTLHPGEAHLGFRNGTRGRQPCRCCRRCWRALACCDSPDTTVRCRGAVNTLWLVCLSDPDGMFLLPCLRRSVVTSVLQAAEKHDSFHREFCLPVALQTAGHAAGRAVLPGVGPSKPALFEDGTKIEIHTMTSANPLLYADGWACGRAPCSRWCWTRPSWRCFVTRDKMILIHVNITFHNVAQAAGHAAGHAVLAGAGPVQAGAVWRRRRPVDAAAGDLACQRGWALCRNAPGLMNKVTANQQSGRRPSFAGHQDSSVTHICHLALAWNPKMALAS